MFETKKTQPVNTDEMVLRANPAMVQPPCCGTCPMSAPVRPQCGSAVRDISDIPAWVMEGG